MTAREPRDITLAEIEQQFELSSYWFGDKWCPAVFRKDDGSYRIRTLKSMTTSGAVILVATYDYFELAVDGTITTVPRGHTKDYKPGRVVDIEAAAARYAKPLPDAMRIGL